MLSSPAENVMGGDVWTLPGGPSDSLGCRPQFFRGGGTSHGFQECYDTGPVAPGYACLVEGIGLTLEGV